MRAVTETKAGENLVFLVGSPRSGTTWLRGLLTASPIVHTGPESYVFGHYISRLTKEWNKEVQRRRRLNDKGLSFTGLSAYFTTDQFNEIVKAFAKNLLEEMTSDLKPGDIFVEKTPLHALFTREIITLLPECKIVHIIRDPRDVVASILRAGQTLGMDPSETNPRGAARLWMSHVKGARSVSELASSGRFLEVRYEDLLTSTEDTLSRTLEFIGAPFERADVVRAIDAFKVESLREGKRPPGVVLMGEAAKNLGEHPEFVKEFVGKATSGNWKEDLSIPAKFWVWYIAGEYMKECGYDWKVPWWYSGMRKVVRGVARRRGER